MSLSFCRCGRDLSKLICYISIELQRPIITWIEITVLLWHREIACWQIALRFSHLKDIGNYLLTSYLYLARKYSFFSYRLSWRKRYRNSHCLVDWWNAKVLREPALKELGTNCNFSVMVIVCWLYIFTKFSCNVMFQPIVSTLYSCYQP